MRTKLIAGKGKDTQVLSVKPGWHEHVLREELDWVESERYPLLVEVSHEERGSSVTTLYYRCSGMRKLSDILPMGIDERLLQSVLVSCADVISVCILAQMDAGFLDLDPSWIFFDREGRLRFSFIPIRRQRSRRTEVPEGHLIRLIEQIAGQECVFNTEKARAQAKIIEQITRRSSDQVTLRAFCSVLEGSLGYRLTQNTMKAIGLLNRRDPGYAETPYQTLTRRETAPQNGTWRGVSLRGSMDSFRRQGGRVSVPEERAEKEWGSASSFSAMSGEGFDVPTAVQADGGADLPTTGTQAQAGCMIVRMRDGDRRLLWSGQTVQLGRGSQNDMQILGNPKISRSHATVEYNNGRLCLRDLDSANGTWVDGKRLNPHQEIYVSIGQRFSLADDEFAVKRVVA